MKPIHLCASKDELRKEFQYIQVKNGFAYCTNRLILIKLPVIEVFGKDIIAEDEELYFKATLWAQNKFDKAGFIVRDGVIFRAHSNKGALLGEINAVLPEAFKAIGILPDIEIAFPTGEPVEINRISLNPSLLLDLCKSFGPSSICFIYTFFGKDKSVIVTPNESKGVGLIFPLVFNEAQFEKIEEPVSDLNIDDISDIL